jgi:hypothetical protein
MKALLISFLYLSIISCSNNANTLNSEAMGSNSSSRDTALGLASVIGDLSPGSGVPSSAISEAKIVVESHPEISATADSSGKFKIANVPPGTYTIFALSSSLVGAKLGLFGASAYGVKISDVVVSADETESLGTNTIKATGSIIGTIDFFSNPNNLDLTGSDVYVPGTSFLVKTNSSGGFSLTGIPEGTYNLRLEHTGFTAATLENVTVVAGQATNIGTKLLSISNGPEGSLSLVPTSTPTIGGQATKASGSRTVTLGLSYDLDAALMKISDESAFINKSWVPVSSTSTWTFTSDGPKRIFVKFSDLNGLESSPYYDDIVVDTEVPQISSFKLLNGWDQLADSSVKVPFSIQSSDNGTGVAKMMISNDSSFSTNSGWIDYQIEYANWNKSGTVYVKVKDYLDHESTYSTDTITLGTHTVIKPVPYDVDVTLTSAFSPYRIEDDLVFNKNLNIGAGVALHVYAGSPKTIKVNGRLNANGTSSSKITATSYSGGFCGFDLTDSDETDNLINYLDATYFTPGTCPVPFIQINGGTVSNVNYLPANTPSIFLGKTGYKDLLIDKVHVSGVTRGIYVYSGTGNTTIKNSFFENENFPYIEQDGGTGTVVENCTFTQNYGFISQPGNDAMVMVKTGTLSLTKSLFNVTEPTTIVESWSAVKAGGTGTVSVTNSNINTFNNSDGSHQGMTRAFVNNGSGTFTSTGNYRNCSGDDCGSVLQIIGTVSEPSSAGVAYPITPGSTCVGWECN